MEPKPITPNQEPEKNNPPQEQSDSPPTLGPDALGPSAAEPGLTDSLHHPDGTSEDNGHKPAPITGGAKPSRRKLWLSLAALIVIAAAAAGYFQYAANKTDTPAPTSANQTASREIPLLRLGTQEGMPEAFYPDPTSMAGVGSIVIQRNVFEGLVSWGENKQFIPQLASSWTNPDENTWVFKLKPNVKFHDGKTMTADDVKASLLADTPVSDTYHLSDVIKSVDVVDPATIKVTTNKPDALLLNRLVYMFIFDSTSKDKNSYQNGTGPYTVKAGTKFDKDNLDLVAFSGYHGTQPAAKEIVGKNYASNEDLVSAAKKKQVDLGFVFSKIDSQEITAVVPGAKFQPIEESGLHALWPDTLKKGSPIQKLKVRQAIYQALDQAQIIKASGADAEPLNQLGPQSVTGYDSSITGPKTDPAAAKKLLAEAGYPNGLTLSILHGPPAAATINEIGRQLKAIGIKLDDHTAHDFAELNDAIQNQTYDMTFYGYTSDFADISDMVTDQFTKTGSHGSYDNAQISQLLAQSNQEFNAAKRIQILQQISRDIMSQVAVIPIYSQTYHIMLAPGFDTPFNVPDGIFGTYLYNIHKL